MGSKRMECFNCVALIGLVMNPEQYYDGQQVKELMTNPTQLELIYINPLVSRFEGGVIYGNAMFDMVTYTS